MGALRQERAGGGLSFRVYYLFRFGRLELFMLVSALMGLDVMQGAYAHTIEAGYRFYSYGDASLLLPSAPGRLEPMA